MEEHVNEVRKFKLSLKDLESNEECSIDVEYIFPDGYNNEELMEILMEIWEGNNCECDCS
jgi:hypothetical protein